MVDRYITSGRRSGARRISSTPAANTNSDSAALYTSGTGMPTSCSTSAMPFSARLATSAFSDEKQIPVMPLPSSLRSLSLAVTTAQRRPAPDSAARIVGARSHFGSFIMTSVPLSTSNR